MKNLLYQSSGYRSFLIVIKDVAGEILAQNK